MKTDENKRKKKQIQKMSTKSEAKRKREEVVAMKSVSVRNSTAQRQYDE